MALTLKELLALPADPEYYFSFPLLPKGGRVIIGAPKKYKKSFLAMNLAYDLAEGSKDYGLFGLQKSMGDPRFPIKRPLSVLYIEKEIGRFRTQERFRAIDQYRKGEFALDNLHIIPKGEQANIMLDTGLATLAEEIEKHKVDVVIFDPLRKFHVQEEDKSTPVVQMILNLDKLQDQFGFTAVFVHHTGKRNDNRDVRDPEALRGSSVWYDDADTIIMLDRPVADNINKIRLNFMLRSSEDPEAIKLDFHKDSFIFTESEKR